MVLRNMWFAVCFLSLLLISCSSSNEDVSDGDIDNAGCPAGCSASMECINGTCVPISGGDNVVTDGDKDNITGDGDLDAIENSDIADIVDSEIDAVDGDFDFDLGDPDIDFDYSLVNCDHNPSLGRTEISVSTNQIDFGAVPIGSATEKNFTICNSGSEDLQVSSIQFSDGTTPEFFKFHDTLAITIPPGKASPVYVMYFPVNSDSDTGEIIILSNDNTIPSKHVTLVSSIKPTPILKITPEIVQFLGADPGDQITKEIEVKNIGLAPTSIIGLKIIGGVESPYTVTSVVKGGEAASDAPWMIDVNEFIIISITMTMGQVPKDDDLDIEWLIDTETVHSKVELTTKDMDICAQPNAGVDQIVRPLDMVYLDGSNSYDLNGTVTQYKWDWAAKPSGANRAVLYNTEGEVIQGLWTTEATPYFYAELAGEYQISLVLKDDVDPECSEVNEDVVNVGAIPDETIHIQLVWSDPGNDFDLHLVKPGGTHSRDCGTEGNDTDCCWSNCDTDKGRETPCPARGCPGPDDSPNWSNPDSRDDDPTLDIDDRGKVTPDDPDGGRGPENINLSLPQIGEYTVAVENFNGSESAMVIVRIYLFGSLRGVFTYGSNSNGIPKHYHWNVCKLKVIDSATIELIALDNQIVYSPDPPTSKGGYTK